MKTLSVRQPYAALICAGVKIVENRSKRTNYRGPLLIHASGQPMAAANSSDFLPEKFLVKCDEFIDDHWHIINAPEENVIKYAKLVIDSWFFYGIDIVSISDEDLDLKTYKQLIKERGYFLPSQAIIGVCDVVDCVEDSTDDFAEEGCFHWILENPYYFKKPILHVLGHLGMWNFDVSDIDVYNQ